MVPSLCPSRPLFGPTRSFALIWECFKLNIVFLSMPWKSYTFMRIVRTSLAILLGRCKGISNICFSSFEPRSVTPASTALTRNPGNLELFFFLFCFGFVFVFFLLHLTQNPRTSVWKYLEKNFSSVKDTSTLSRDSWLDHKIKLLSLDRSFLRLLVL